MKAPGLIIVRRHYHCYVKIIREQQLLEKRVNCLQKATNKSCLPLIRKIATLQWHNREKISAENKQFCSLLTYYLLFLIMFYSLCYYSCPNFMPLSPSIPPPTSGNAYTVSMSMGHAYVFSGYSIPYAVLYIPMTILQLL